MIREDNFFRGLSDAMIDQNFNWCARCQVFALHTLDMSMPPVGICPTTWVGPPPTFNANGTTGTLTCTFQGCPPGTTANATTSVCDPPCPMGHFDPVRLVCVPDIIIK